jgi:uncharacterized protein with ParB-like and HNH nuclease domain
MPKVDTTVRELVDMVKRGELRLPEMQRRYVWTAGRVRDLLDSLYRAYHRELSSCGKPITSLRLEISQSVKHEIFS